MVERAVACDAVEPGPDVDGALVGEDGVEGGGEDLLEDVLGVLAGAEQVAAEGEQAALIAADQDIERALVATTDERDETLVRLQPEEWRAAMQACAPGVSEC